MFLNLIDFSSPLTYFVGLITAFISGLISQRFFTPLFDSIIEWLESSNSWIGIVYGKLVWFFTQLFNIREMPFMLERYGWEYKILGLPI
jgi:hypothetical protein